MKKILFLCCFISVLHGMETSIKKESHTKRDRINLILGLDNVLVHDPLQGMEKIDQILLKKTFLVQDSDCDKYVVPAYLSEFLKFVLSRFNVSFFGQTYNERNITVVENIWKKVFGVCKPENIQVLGRNDLGYAGNGGKFQPHVGGECWQGQYKKDIRRIGELHNTILVDDDKSYVLNGQEFNALLVSGADFHDLEKIVERDVYADNHDQMIGEDLASRWCAHELLAFYKLLYVVGLLDIAAQHKTSIIDGLRAIQFEDGMPMFSERQKDLQYYKRGYKVLLNFSITEQEKTMMHLLQAHPEIHWAVLPPEIRQLIVGYMMQLIQQNMCLFPEIEKYFYQ